MADIVGHPWMQLPHATAAEVKEEFAERHRKVKEAREIEDQKKHEQRQQHAVHRGVRRGDKIGDKVFLSASNAEHEESKEGYTILDINKFEYVPGKNTQFFSTYETEYVFAKLVEYLDDHKIKPDYSETHFKLKFEKERMPEEDAEEDAEQAKAKKVDEAVEKVLMQVEIQKVDDSKICVDFKRKAGSSWLFFEQFNYIRDAMYELNDATFEPAAK